MLGTVEAAWDYLLRHPEKLKSLPSGIHKNIQAQYLSHDRKIIQFMPECAERDDELTYRLKPGSCQFTNPEFTTTVQVNSKGCRDDEASLNAPEIIVLGDSIAMGWGVTQGQTLDAIIEKQIGMKVLNCATSSYATAREMGAFKRLDRSALKYLVILYNDNDFMENMEFAQRGIMSQEDYQSYVEQHKRDSSYYPGKHLVIFVQRAIEMLFAPAMPDPDAMSAATRQMRAGMEADVFVRVLMDAEGLNGIKIIVTEVNSFNSNDSEFADALREVATDEMLPDWVQNIQAIDSSKLLTNDDYYILDDHLRPQGHEKLASAIMRRMK